MEYISGTATLAFAIGFAAGSVVFPKKFVKSTENKLSNPEDELSYYDASSVDNPFDLEDELSYYDESSLENSLDLEDDDLFDVDDSELPVAKEIHLIYVISLSEEDGEYDEKKMKKMKKMKMMMKKRMNKTKHLIGAFVCTKIKIMTLNAKKKRFSTIIFIFQVQWRRNALFTSKALHQHNHASLCNQIRRNFAIFRNGCSPGDNSTISSNSHCIAMFALNMNNIFQICRNITLTIIV